MSILSLFIPPGPDSTERYSYRRKIAHRSLKFKGYAVTGGQDAVINVFNLDAPKDDPDFCLLGHTENICALDVTPGGVIISGSWTGNPSLPLLFLTECSLARTAKVWKNFTLATI